MKLSRRTFLKALGLGAAALPVIAKAHPEQKLIPVKNIRATVNGEEIPTEISNWKQATPDEIIADINDAFNSISPPQHINCRCKTTELAHDKYLDEWAGISGVCRKPGETDSELRNRISAKIKGV